MSRYTTQAIRSVALVGHGAVGKTSLAEALLLATGAIPAKGSIERGTTVCDFEPQEKEAGHSLNSAVVNFAYEDAHIHLIDTAGFPDFSGTSIAALAGVDTALIVINAQTGIELMTERMMQYASDRKLARMIVVNKIDAENIDLPALISQIRNTFGKQCMVLDLPAHGGADVVEVLEHNAGDTDFESVANAHRALIDQIIEEDEDLLAQYLEDGADPSAADLHAPFEKALRKANIPYKVSGGTSFFDRAEIRDLCAWFRLWINNDDDPAFLRAITAPKRGVGHTTLGALGEFATQHKQSMFGALFNAMLPAVVPKRGLEGLMEFGRQINELEHRARHTHGFEAARAFLADWLKDIAYEQHLYDGEDSEKVAAARWSNVLEFCDWMAQRAGGQIDDAAGTTVAPTKNLLEVAQTIALLSTISEREQEQDMVVLSTLHASKGLEWPHVMLVGVTEGMLPFKLDDDDGRQQKVSDDIAARLQEERRLMYVGITRAQRSLAVSWTKKRKKGREMVACQPSRFIAEMKLDAATTREDPREKLRQLRAEFAAKAQAGAGTNP